MENIQSPVSKGLVAKLKRKEAVIGIVGLGYVGLPLILSYCSAGFKVVGFDVDAKKIQLLTNGKSYIKHISDAAVESAISEGLEVTDDFKSVAGMDVLILCVPTPLNEYREPDLSFVTETVDSLVPYLRSGQVVSLESTTYPGTTEEELLPRMESTGLRVGHEIFLVYSPEREDPGNLKFTTRDIPKVCGGQTASCLEVGVALYEQVIDRVVPVSSTRVAELTKLLENIHRAVNIGLVNEMKIVADRMGIDIYEVIRAAATKPFGFVPYYPGPGLGGHCIPIDPFYLTWKAREYGVHTRFIELAGEINSSMPDYVIDKVVQGLNSQKRAVNGSRILLLGIAYKKNVDDMRESPSVVLMEKLNGLGAEVQYSDPHIPVFPDLRRHDFNLSSQELTPHNIASYDCVLLATDHDDFNFPLIEKNAKLIVDCRGRYQGAIEHIIKA
jgi:UDP-N-acetyl-D-glucosamine dehydrogenase